MTPRVPPLETERLLIREFVLDDLAVVGRLVGTEGLPDWLEWTLLSYAQLARLHQPPYGDRAIVLQASGEVIGACGYVPLLAPFGLDFSFSRDAPRDAQRSTPKGGARGVVAPRRATERSTLKGGARGVVAPRRATERYTPEFGLYWSVLPEYQRRGYATEAAQALVSYAFCELRLDHIVATTTFDNVGSIGVMRKLGMRIERNPRPDPPWLQVVGILQSHPTPDALADVPAPS